jgi:CBS domain-containing protein
VIERDGLLRGTMSLLGLRTVPVKDWNRVRVEEVMDASPRTLCPQNTVAEARRALSAGADCVPIVDPLTYHLVGIVSLTDVERAAAQAVESQEVLGS